jgi:hypothetical protein
MTRQEFSGTLLWRFLCVEHAGWLRWEWQVWTQTGRLVATSRQSFETLTECEADATAAGYISPEKRL